MIGAVAQMQKTMRQIPESDWKTLRQVHAAALERFCKQILMEIERVNSDSTKSFREKYLDVWQVLRQRDKEMAKTFDDLRRSRALFQLAAMKARGLVNEDEFLRFSQETRDLVSRLLED